MRYNHPVKRTLTALAAVLAGVLVAAAITAAALTVGALAASAGTSVIPIAQVTHAPKQDAPHEIPLPAVPLLAITVSDAVTTPHTGDTLTYTITLTNRDRLALPMRIRLTPPSALTAATPSDGGTLAGPALTWPLTLAPDQRATLHFTATVAGTRANGTRLAITACSYLTGSDRPTACASDLDQIAPTRALPWRTLALGGGALLALLLALALWRRFRPAPTPARTATEDSSVTLARQVVAELHSTRAPAEPAEPATPGTSDGVRHH